MPAWDAKYTEAQREAAAVAYVDRQVRPARAVVQLAAAGDLIYGDGKLDPFTISETAIREYASQLRKKRRGTLKSGLTDASHGDAVERLRKRLVSAADHELSRIERMQARNNRTGTADPEHVRQAARMVREIAALPGKNDPRTVKPGMRTPGTKDTETGQVNSGLAGKIINAHRKPAQAPNLSAVPDPHTAPLVPVDDVETGVEDRLQAVPLGPAEAEDNKITWSTAHARAAAHEEADAAQAAADSVETQDTQDTQQADALPDHWQRARAEALRDNNVSTPTHEPSVP